VRSAINKQLAPTASQGKLSGPVKLSVSKLGMLTVGKPADWIICARRAGRLLMGLVLLLVCTGTVRAMIFAPSDPVEITPGELLTHSVDWQRSPGLRVEVKLAEAPSGARLLVDQSGELYVSWQTGPDMPEKNVFVLLARNVDTDQELERSQLLVLRIVEPVQRTEPEAPKLGPFEHQYLQVGVPWQLELDVKSISQEPVTILAQGLPSGAMLSVAPNGNHDIDWTPAQGQHGRRRFTLRAVNTSTPSVFSEQQIMLTVAPRSLPEKNIGSDAVSLKSPLLSPLPNQIISAGRVVSFTVKPLLEDGAQAILQVDRLPRNASFDENQDGSRTFYWQTSDKDQGEHLFRFTAIHPMDSALRAWREILIVVGDPSRSSTAPVDAPQGS